MLTQASLKKYNSFGVDYKARWLAELHSPQDLQQLRHAKEYANAPKLVLGFGSNVLFTANFEGIVLVNRLKGIQKVSEDRESVVLKIASGEDWSELVANTVKAGWSGLENLALIPGSVGAAPIQNIGAYGVEFASACLEVETLDLDTLTSRQYKAPDCKFGYRQSIFKSSTGRSVITSVTLALAKDFTPRVSYRELANHLTGLGKRTITVHDVFAAVVSIRRSKLPDPAVLGNAGSFFKNPEVTHERYIELKGLYPELAGFATEAGTMKLSAAWLIENSGWKGARCGNTGVYERHALILVNYGGASGAEILELSEKIKSSVLETFGVQLDREVQVI